MATAPNLDVDRKMARTIGNVAEYHFDADASGQIALLEFHPMYRNGCLP